MLRIMVEVNHIEDKITKPSGYFDAEYDETWFQTQLAKDIIKGIDLSEYIDGDYIKSPVFGGMSPTRLSTGCKGCLLLLNRPDLVVSGERFGDNCFEWLSKIGEQQDITITLCHFLMDDNIPMHAVVVNNGVEIFTSGELTHVMFDVIGEGPSSDN